MKIFLDTADVDQIKSAYDTGLVDGVTTNPTIILRSGRQLYDTIEEISTSFPLLESISAEVVGDTKEEMLTQVKQYYDYKIGYNIVNWGKYLSPVVTIKVPCTPEGLKVCKELSLSGIKTNVTLVFSVAQAILASKAGATYVSPFVGRWLDNSVDGIELIKNIRKVYDQAFSHDHTFSGTQILAASIRDVRQVEQCILAGADVVTIPPVVFWSMYKNVLTEKGLEQFNKDWGDVIKNQ